MSERWKIKFLNGEFIEVNGTPQLVIGVDRNSIYFNDETGRLVFLTQFESILWAKQTRKGESQ